MAPRYKVGDEQLEELIHLYCRDLTALARENRFDPITGRDKEIELSTLILLQKGRKNVILLAPAGVGKTALVIGLAQNVAAGTVPPRRMPWVRAPWGLATMGVTQFESSLISGRAFPI